MVENTIKEDFGADSLEAMLHDGKVPYLHMQRAVALESPVSIRQFRREWFAALKLLFGSHPAPKDDGVDTTPALTYWAKLRVGIKDGEWIYRLSISRNTLLAPAVNRVEIVAHEVAHLLQYYDKYVREGKTQGAEQIRLENRFDFLNHGEDWQAIYKDFYKKLKVANIIETGSEYEKHAAMLLEKRRQAWADPEWRDGYKARIKDDHVKTANKRRPAKAEPTLAGRVKSHRRRTEKGKLVTVHGYQRKPRRS